MLEGWINKIVTDQGAMTSFIFVNYDLLCCCMLLIGNMSCLTSMSVASNAVPSILCESSHWYCVRYPCTARTCYLDLAIFMLEDST